MSGTFDLLGFNVLEALAVVGLLAAAAVVLARGRGSGWSLCAAGGFALVALARLGAVVLQVWLVRDNDVPLHQRIQVLQWSNGVLWVLSTAGFALLLAALLARSRDTPPVAQAG